MRRVIKSTAINVASVLAPIFKLHRWTWHDSGLPPTASRIAGTVEELIEDCIKNNYGYCGTGRIAVKGDKDEDDHIELTISLEVGKIYIMPDGKMEEGGS